MKRLLLAVICLFVAAFAAADGYQIDRYQVDLNLDNSGNLDVKETLLVSFTADRRGIFRDIPTSYETKTGTTRSIRISNFSVTNEDGNPLTTQFTRQGVNQRIRIGDADIVFPPGTQKTYVISYRARGILNWFDENTDWEPSVQLYWNAIGELWDANIGKVEVNVRFPNVPNEKVRAKIFVGPYGSRINQLLNQPGLDGSNATKTESRLTSNSLTVSREVTLPAYNALTVVIDLPYKTIAKPSQAEVVGEVVQSNLGFTLPIFALLGMGTLWLKNGRDAKARPLTVAFDPPDGLTGSEAGTLLDERVDPRDLAAGIISLAVNGYLTIHPDEEGWIFKRRTANLHLTGKPSGSELSAFERQLLAALLVAGGEIDESAMRTHVAPHAVEFRGALYDSMVTRGYYKGNPENARVAYGILGFLAIGALGIGFVFLSATKEIIPSIAGGVLSLPFIIGFATQMPKRTAAGNAARDQVRGFEEFMRRARADEIDWLTKNENAPELFEKYLPHAIAFGLAREWAARFEGLLKEMPSWYVTPGYHGGFNYIWFSNDIVTVSDAMGTAAMTPPRSSGASGGGSGFSSGGGFSGGGFGGGGGGSW